MYALGVSAFYHDSAACLIKDGEILSAVQEERFTRKKGDPDFPVYAIQYCLTEAGIEISDIDYLAFYENPYVKFDRLIETYGAYWPRALKLFKDSFPVWSKDRLLFVEAIQRELGDSFRGKIVYSDHHLSHAASAFFPSPFEESAILTLDAVGEWSTSSIGIGEGNHIKLIREEHFPHSLGMLYSAFTYYSGFKVNSGEYKLMGLAPFGVPKYADLIESEIIEIYEDGSLYMDQSFFDYAQGRSMTSDKFHKLFGGKPRKPEDVITQKEMDLAASIQKVTEKIIMNAASYAYGITGKKNLVLAGGVALNCVANGKLLREGPFENIWIQPAAGDAGGALGAALLVWYHRLGNTRIINPDDSQKGSFLGPSFTNLQTEAYLGSVGAVYHYYKNEDALLEFVAGQLASEKIIGWFHGRMEFGPRALGARSIIGDARSEKMQQVMNLKIKYRESFRPFAPCVLIDHAHEYFEMEKNQESPYMLFVAPVKDRHRKELSPEEIKIMNDPDLRKRISISRSTVPAITHVDFSARVQTISEKRNGRFYKLMDRFYETTGCPVIVNTSFNIRGEPIVCSPHNAYICFMATDMDCLVIDDFILIKDEQPTGLLPELDLYKQSMAMD